VNKIELVSQDELEARLRESLERRELPDYFLYLGDRGVMRWLELDRSAEFSIASRLTNLLRAHLPRILTHLPKSLDLVSIGCGAGRKERLLLDALLRQRSVRYLPVDVSSRMVDVALNMVADLDIDKIGLVGLFEDLPRLRAHWRSPVLLCMLGNSVCNHEPDDLMSTVYSVFEERDYFLFDCHLFSANAESVDRWRVAFERAYHSELNVRFNIGPLTDRGLQPSDCDFSLELAPVETPFGGAFLTRKTITIVSDGSVEVAGSRVELGAGDTLNMGFTYKFRHSQVQGFAQRHNLTTVDESVSRDGENLLVLARKGVSSG
jgi:hypothetical protein